MKTVTIRLAGLLQSYGSEANFNYRTTLGYPSKSAVIGMIAAAFGYERDNPAINRLNNLAFAVRIDQPGRALQDFQMVHMQKGKQIQSKITYRDYLQDAVFVVAIGSEDSELIEKNPIFVETSKILVISWPTGERSWWYVANQSV
ncbi:type I-E CRISPR-associated protein Cas5/CasD [Amylolactobacillus amylophilus]|uniref:type I-E CRISPR-associated protein Cas5/CasD n=1 Tax=Amylolactobacillus amylophilus TaxID=1603 RepID=UPI000AE9BB5A